MTALKLLVVRCKNIEASKEFYEKLGLNFVTEKHGKGPTHYSTNMDGVIFELYPLKPEPVTSMRITGDKILV